MKEELKIFVVSSRDNEDKLSAIVVNALNSSEASKQGEILGWDSITVRPIYPSPNPSILFKL